MKINRLRMVNFRQHARTEIAFHTGMTAIIGDNGSGKTTILEAIAWALYGQTAIRGQRDGIRFLGAGSRAPVEVELDFELGGHRYLVTRGLTTAALYLDGSDAPVANSITGVNDLLSRRLGMSRAEFFNTYFTGQKDLAVMAAMGPTERAQFLSRVLGYERLRAAQELAREKRRLITAEMNGLRSGMPDSDAVARELADAAARLESAVGASEAATARYATAAAELQGLSPEWENQQRERERWQRLLAEITIAEREVTSLQREADRLATELVSLATAHEELATLRTAVAPLAELRAENERLDEVYRLQGRRAALVENERALVDEISRLAERLARLGTAPALEAEAAGELEREATALEAVTRTLEGRRTEWVRDRQEAETKLQELRRQYADTKKQRDAVVDLGAEGVCPTCRRVLGPSYRAVVGQLSELLETLQVDGQYYRDRGEQLAAVPPEIVELEERRRAVVTNQSQLERKLARIQAAVQDMAVAQREMTTKQERLAETQREIASISEEYDAERHRVVRAEVERLTPLSLRVARLEASVERLPLAMEEQRRIQADTAAARDRRDSLRGQGATLEFSEAAYDRTRVAYSRAAETVRSAELALVAARGETDAARQAVQRAETARAEYQRMADKLQQLGNDRLVHDELDRAFQDLRTDLNDALRPELSEVASSFLRSLTDGRYDQMELNEKYDVVILEDGVEKPIISGGEEDIANLVLRLAISQMIADRSGQPFSLLVLDEVFGSLDASRRESVLDLLHRLEDHFEQVILITHIESVREGVDRVITVRYDAETGESRVDSDDSEPVYALETNSEVMELA